MLMRLCLCLCAYGHAYAQVRTAYDKNRWVRSSYVCTYAYVVGVLTCLCYAYACAYAYALVRTSL